jgi:Asp-tRNA(Asn)/Glu-tRNA(Gln) amidotransferase C subunit
MAHPFESHNRLAADIPVEGLSIEAVLMNAPAVEGRFLAVPKVLAEGD